MPANSTHPYYDAALPFWLRARDMVSGEDAVKAAGEKYLPRLTSQTDAGYSAYKTRASFFNATARTADGYVGLIFRREPTFKLPPTASGVGKALCALVEDADMLGTSLPSYAKHVVNEVIALDRCGTLIDWGSLRGGISVALALSLPAGPQRELILAVTYVIVVFSILVQGPTLNQLIKRVSAG